MSRHQLKLAIIQRIIQAEDEQLLQTVYQLLNQFGQSNSNDNTQLIAALLDEKITPTTIVDSTTPPQQDIDDLQQSINEAFGIE